MRLCIGEPLTTPTWTGLPLGRFAPPVTDGATPVAAVQDTVFVWKDGASPASVRSRRETTHYRRFNGVLDVMSVDEEAWISHDVIEAPGECLLVAVSPEFRETWTHDMRESSAPAIRSVFGENDTQLHGLALALEQQCLNGEPWGRLYTESLSTALAAYVSSRYSSQPSEISARRLRHATGQFSSTHRRRLYEFIEQRLQDNLSLQELAALSNCSPQHFVRLFRRTFSVSPHQYLIHRRIQRAKLLLRHRPISLAEIAHDCGFADQSHFTRTFARYTGVTPRRFRNN